MTSMRFYHGLLGLLAFQLVLVALGASYVDLQDFGPIGRTLNYWGELTGANKSYGFFAPGIGGQVRTRFEVTDVEGRKTQVNLFANVSHEAELRIGNITEKVSADDEDAKSMQRSMSASLAGKVFGRHPTAREVTVHLDEFVPANAQEYRDGARPAWTEIYSATYRHEPSTSSSGDEATP